MIEVKVLLFALLRDITGKDELNIKVGEGATVGDAITIIKRHLPALERFPIDSFMIAVNMEYVSRDYLLKDGDIIAIIPPVGGGR
ncbi:MAG: MoaD/ThiS family protein [Candidatus Aenigmatarchaeota archaeon]